jgi:DNA-binding protein HU-beta
MPLEGGLTSRFDSRHGGKSCLRNGFIRLHTRTFVRDIERESSIRVSEERVNKAEIVEALQDRLGGRQSASDALDAVIDTITRAVVRGEKVTISGFGSFEKAVRNARTGRNPRTGEKVRIKKTSVPRFRAGTSFKTYVADPKALPKPVAGARAATTRGAAAAAAAAKAAGPGKKSAAKATATKATATKTAATKTTTRKVAAKAPARTAAVKATPAKTAVKAPARKVVTKATPVKSAATRTAAKTTATKTAAKAPARKLAARTTATKAPAKTVAKAPAKTTAAKTVAKKAPAKSVAKTTVRKTAAKTTASRATTVKAPSPIPARRLSPRRIAR